MGRKPPPPPPGSVTAQATEATRALREALADAKRQTRECVAELESAAQRSAEQLRMVVNQAELLRRGFQGLVQSRLDLLVKGLEPGWERLIKEELERGLAEARAALHQHLDLAVATLDAAQESFQVKNRQVDTLVAWLDETLRNMVTSDLFPHMSLRPPTQIVRADKAKQP